MPGLRRYITLPLLTLYGLGTILGAGIYVLIGEVAAAAGVYTPFAFILAAVVAGFTGLAYAELSTRFPVSAGEVAYVDGGFDRKKLSIATGIAVILTGVISAATIANGFSGYLQVFLDVPDAVAIIVLLVALGAIAVIGIAESVWTAAAITLIEAAGLLLVISLGAGDLNTLPERLSRASQDASHPTLLVGALAGAHLAFYAYIGFEDMINVAEEVHNPHETLPRSIILALIGASLLYVAVALVAVSSLDAGTLRNSSAPLAAILGAHGFSPVLISAIGLLAIVNGALVQIVMASRVVYGMAVRGMAPALFARIHSRTRTPHVATALVTVIILAAALWFPLRTLALSASTVALVLFALVNGALIALRRQPATAGIWHAPVWAPYAGLVTCLLLAGFGVAEALK